MLLYEHEGFIEAEAKEIQQLCRSAIAVSFGNPEQNKYELQASLAIIWIKMNSAVALPSMTKA